MQVECQSTWSPPKWLDEQCLDQWQVHSKVRLGHGGAVVDRPWAAAPWRFWQTLFTGADGQVNVIAACPTPRLASKLKPNAWGGIQLSGLYPTSCSTTVVLLLYCHLADSTSVLDLLDCEQAQAKKQLEVTCKMEHCYLLLSSPCVDSYKCRSTVLALYYSVRLRLECSMLRNCSCNNTMSSCIVNHEIRRSS